MPNVEDGTLSTVWFKDDKFGKQYFGSHTIVLNPNSACHFTATNNMDEFVKKEPGVKAGPFVMGVGFMLND